MSIKCLEDLRDRNVSIKCFFNHKNYTSRYSYRASSFFAHLYMFVYTPFFIAFCLKKGIFIIFFRNDRRCTTANADSRSAISFNLI